MRSQPVQVGSRVIDSLQFSTHGSAEQARALRCSGIDGVVLYLGHATRERVEHCIEAGLGVMAVTRANRWDGADSASDALQCELAPGTTVWLDLEGTDTLRIPTRELIARIDDWASCVSGAGYEPGIYVGAPQPLTSSELWRLRTVRYWRSQSRVVDRTGLPAEPKCGWCMWQARPQTIWRSTGVLVDVNLVTEDHLGRLPTWSVT